MSDDKRTQNKWTRWFRRGRYEAELEQELQFHIEARAADLERDQGLEKEAALRRAQREFGPKEAAKDYCRDHDGVQWFDELRRNVSFARRMFLRRPGLFASITVTLALCIAANIMIFAVVDAVLLQALPYPNPEELHIVESLHGEDQTDRRAHLDGRTWEAVEEGVTSAPVAVVSFGGQEVNFVPPNAGGQARASLVHQQRVGRGFFEVLGVPLARGRTFTRGEDSENGPKVAVISHRLWQERFDGAEEAVGSRFTLAGEPHTVVGIAGERFTSRNDASVWVPLRATTTGEGSGTNYQIMLRAESGSRRLATVADLKRVGEELEEIKGDTSFSLGIIALQDWEVASLESRLLLLWLAVALVLLIGCVNVAGLLFATASQRASEIATRRALGGGVASVFRQLLTESFFLAVCGGILGVLVAVAGLRWLRVLNAGTLGLWQDFGLDLRLLAVVLVVTLVSTALFGIAPSVAMARSSASQMGGRGGRRGDSWGRRLLVALQVAVGVALLLTAGLLVRTLLHLGGGESGVDSDGIYTATISLNDARFTDTEEVARYFAAGIDLLNREPMVVGAGAALSMPYERPLNWSFRYRGLEDVRVAAVNYVAPGTLKLLGVELEQGRGLEPSDGADAPPVTLVNRAFVERYLAPTEDKRAGLVPAGPVIGETLRFSWNEDGPETEVVGVVGDVRQRPSFNWTAPLQSDVPTVYLPMAQLDDGTMRMAHTWFRPSWVVKARESSGSVQETIRSTLEALDPLTPVASIRQLEDFRSSALAMERFQAILFAILAGLAVVLAAVGVAGATASSFARRRKELGIRLALGATVPSAVGRVALPSLLVVAVGILVGLGLAQLGARGVAHMLYGVGQQDPVAYVAAVVGLMVVAGLACLVPALRVVRLPVVATLQDDG